MVIHSGKTQAQVARALGCSEYSLKSVGKGVFEATSRLRSTDSK
jgi:hypothetical protein